MPIDIQKKSGEFWLHFLCESTGRHALINMSHLAEQKGPIIGTAIIETLEEMNKSSKTSERGRI